MVAAANAPRRHVRRPAAAGADETDRMSVEDTVWKTAGLFGILLVTAAIGWVLTLGGLDVPKYNLYSEFPAQHVAVDRRRTRRRARDGHHVHVRQEGPAR